mmetsp:Transcript_28108/g.40241  ORF Transcript_28108/g.40241 Transcript_28108/m.40241 type:complete len:1031 (-) Transcript_28108:70-3162(-)
MFLFMLLDKLYFLIVCTAPHLSSAFHSNNHVSSETQHYSFSPLSAQRAGADGFSIVRQPVTWGEQPQDSKSTGRRSWRDDSARPPPSFFAGSPSPKDNTSLKPPAYRIQEEEDEEEVASIDHINLHRRTRETLDYFKITAALQSMCATIPAKRIIQRDERDSKSEVITSSRDVNNDNDIRTMRLYASSVQGVHERYGAVQEMQVALTIPSIKPFPITGSPDLNLAPLFEFVENTNQPLEGPDIVEVAGTIETLQLLSQWCLTLNQMATTSKQKKNPKLPLNSAESNVIHDANNNSTLFLHLVKLGEYIDIDPMLQELLKNALDDKGRLCGDTFPGIGRLRNKIEQRQRDILATVNQLVQTPAISSKLATESGGSIISEVDGRIVIPIDVRYRSSVGIVHDMSRSGKTCYVEPTSIIEPTNELRQAEGELRQEEARVWRMLTDKIMEHRESIERSIAAAAQLDLVMARVRLGNKLLCVIPQVRDEGVIQAKDARHPILLLRELGNVVGSDIDLGANGNQGLILSGPNSGGKTIILKLIGLFALMARDGIPIPAQSARVDFFNPVLADIGDIQSVGGDLSTFSGHMLVCREVLASSGKRALVLMDELGSGTDPSQGVAIAQALLEALVENGSRVVITTHYMALKQLAAADDRFSVAAMQFSNGRPTYSLLTGAIGESFALSVAERLNLPPFVIQRANELLDQDTRHMGELITKLEEQRAVVDQQVEDLARRQQEIESLQLEMERAQSKLVQQQLNARRDEANKFAKRLEEKEKILEDILEMLKSDPTKRLVAKSWDDLQFIKRDAIIEAEFVSGRKREIPSDSFQLIPISELDDMPKLKVGDKVIVCKPGFALGKESTITKVSDRAIEVSVGGMALRMKYSDVALPSEAMSLRIASEREARVGQERKLSKFARRALGEGQDDTDASRSRRNTEVEHVKVETSSQPTMRTPSTTLDLRGCNLSEFQLKCDSFFSSMRIQGRIFVYLLHGHGTGALKTKLRDWLSRERQYVKRFAPAEQADGGDAFTLVELKRL